MARKIANLQDGNEITYWTHHDNKRRTLILVHGFTGSHAGFQYLVPLLKDFRLIIPDLPGFGVSPLPHNKLTLAELGKLLAEFVQGLKLKESPYLVGHSMGSLVVCEAVKQHPELFAKKLVLASPVPSPVTLLDGRKPGAILSKLFYGASHRLPYAGKRIAVSRKISRIGTDLIMTAKHIDLKKAIREHHYDNLNYISDIGWYRRLYKEINKTGISNYSDILEAFDILIINGENDVVTPLKHQRRAAKLLRAQIIVVPEVGHLAHYEKPNELAKAISDFLQ